MNNLLKAIINYPDGTRFIGACNEYVSTGDFGTWRIGFDESKKGSIWRIEEGAYSGIIFNSETSQWATIIPEKQPSILDGNSVVEVENQKQFDLVLKHKKEDTYKMTYQFPIYVYLDHRSFDELHIIERDNRKIIPFADFAKEIGITPPIFIMKSEDGVDLYEGDVHECARLNPNGKWEHACQQRLRPDQLVVEEPHRVKGFSSIVNCEKWIEEQNKPKSIMVSEKTPYPIEVGPKYLVIHCKNTDNHLDNIIIKDYEIKEIWEAYQSLQ